MFLEQKQDKSNKFYKTNKATCQTYNGCLVKINIKIYQECLDTANAYGKVKRKTYWK